MFTRYSDLPAIKSLWAKASPAEKGQIVAFVRANSEPKYWPYEAWGYWCLCHINNLDTGRLFLTVSLKLQPPGVSANEMREVIGLPKVKQNYSLVPPKKEEPVVRKKFAKGKKIN